MEIGLRRKIGENDVYREREGINKN